MTIEYRCSECSNLIADAFSSKCPSCGKNFMQEKPIEPEKKTIHLNPDNPAWGFGSSLIIWLLSVILIIFAQVPALVAWMLWLKASGQTMPPFLDIEKHPEIAVFGVASTFLSHIVTVAICYRFITKTSKGKFLPALGWHWPEKFGLLKTIGLTFLTFFCFAIIASLLPNKENQMQKLIESSMAARFSIGFVAIVGAPFVEEIIYRGILFSGLCRDFGHKAAIFGVSFLFLLVHIPQYWGAWGGILGLAFLSTVLTLVRAYSGSLLPCFVMHLIFNSVQVSLIIAQGIGILPKES
ncbi:MAG: CPBP family intramembrane metalloprotease [Acidobacteria bacterium]|nr:CPBP family intramembrane metalloprotease [Acidobacteriota bacterium]